MNPSIISKKVIFLLLTINTISSSIIHSIKEKEEHFVNVYNQKFIIAIFYNKEKCQKMELLNEFIQHLNSSDIIKENSIIIEKIDYGNIDFFQNHYELEKSIQFELFIRNKRNIFHEFHDLFKEGNFKKIKNSVDEFLKKKINKAVTKINNLNTLLRNVKENNLLGLYLGKENKNFDEFVSLAQNYSDFKFYFNFNNETKKHIFNYFSKNKYLDKDVFLMIRDKSLIDEFDKDEIIIYDFDSELNIEFFFEMEKHPKLRLDNHKKNISDIFLKQQMVMVFLISSKTNEEKIKIFKKSIKRLPKKFIFTYVSIEKEESLGYIQLFLMNRLGYEADNLYLIYSLSNQILEIKKMDKSFSENNIVEFANNFLVDHGLNFNNKKKEL